VIEEDEDKAEQAAEWLKAAMVDAMAPLIDPIPVDVEVKIGRTWGG
jgi:DNA polymerase I-like protein with 3'-5' exonuclease and polymerase domains